MQLALGLACWKERVGHPKQIVSNPPKCEGRGMAQMNSYETGSRLLQAVTMLIAALAIGPWLTISGLRIILKPSRVKQKSLINWLIRLYSARSSLATGNIRFWAWTIFLSGVIGDLLAVLMLVAIIGILLRW